MATTGVGFRWLDILEKEFDKACVELDTSLAELEAEEPEVVFSARQKIATLSSCFAQLTHKALTIFQNSAKVEAELVDMRAELVQTRTDGCRDDEDSVGHASDMLRARAEAAQLARENAALRETVLALHSELFGARLATKYLDKELAGRIQQLQLLGRDMRAEVRDSLWAQVEAEILLQRHKTLVRVCRGVSPRPPAPHPAAAAAPAARRARPRTVRVRRSPHLGLGISVTGGREHGVPILISELEAGGPAALTGELYVGDAILAINDVDLTQACHKEAVQALQSVKGDCALCVQYIATDDDDRLSEDNYRFPLYPEEGDVFEVEHDGSGATPTAPRTPDYNRRESVGSASERGSCAARGDYGALNNNLAILDMDDDNIKIEARLEPTSRGGYRLAAESSNDSQSTPVHVRRAAAKKKRKPQDWRTKGAYRAVEVSAASSDEEAHTCPHSPHAPLAPQPPLAPLPTRSPPPPPPPPPATPPPLVARTPERPAHTVAQPPSPPPPEDRGPRYSSPPGVPERGNPVGPPAAPISPPQVETRPPLVNGDVKPLRRESKGFRIGSARRVTEVALTNGDAERYPARLLAGDGDPDFGTPV